MNFWEFVERNFEYLIVTMFIFGILVLFTLVLILNS